MVFAGRIPIRVKRREEAQPSGTTLRSTRRNSSVWRVTPVLAKMLRSWLRAVWRLMS